MIVVTNVLKKAFGIIVLVVMINVVQEIVAASAATKDWSDASLEDLEKEIARLSAAKDASTDQQDASLPVAPAEAALASAPVAEVPVVSANSVSSLATTAQAKNDQPVATSQTGASVVPKDQPVPTILAPATTASVKPVQSESVAVAGLPFQAAITPAVTVVVPAQPVTNLATTPVASAVKNTGTTAQAETVLPVALPVATEIVPSVAQPLGANLVTSVTTPALTTVVTPALMPATQQVISPISQQSSPAQAVQQPMPAMNLSTQIVSQIPPVAQKQQSSVLAISDADKITDQDIESIDTLKHKDPQGNWLFKRIWWEKAELLYEKIKGLVEKIIDARMPFFAQRNELDRNMLDQFYVQIGIGQGELQELLADLLEKLNQERKKDGELSEQEKALITKLNAEKQDLEKLKAAAEGITKIDHAIDDSLATLMEQINVCRHYEQSAWNDFKNIAKELSDENARKLFHSMDVAKENVHKIDGYIKNEFTNHFNQLISKIKEQMNLVKSQLKSLKEKGIDLKEQLQAIDDYEQNAQQQAQERTKKKATSAVIEAEKQEVQEKGFLASVWGSVAGTVSSWYSSLKGIFGLGANEQQKSVSQVSVPPVKAPVAQSASKVQRPAQSVKPAGLAASPFAPPATPAVIGINLPPVISTQAAPEQDAD